MGEIMAVKITDLNPHGALCELDNGIKGVMTLDHMTGVSCDVGQTVQAVILHVDPLNMCAELSLNQPLIKAITQHKDNKFSQVTGLHRLFFLIFFFFFCRDL